MLSLKCKSSIVVIMVNSAGVLPFSRNDAGEIVFLIGRDIRDSVFSDFGGKIETVDRGDLVNTAAREFYEEILGILCNSPYDIRKRVRELSMCLLGSTKNQHIYRMYVMEVPYYHDLPCRFKKVMNFMKYKNIGNNYIEKTELMWCTLDELLRIPKRQVFTNTINYNLNSIKRILTEPWRNLCTEYKMSSSSPGSSGTSPPETKGKYILPCHR
ncbi:hypothetical protein PBCVFr5L_375R [Paramecium bursaria Chlorella virus Fr5L]|nr:hypothetical protein PBCVCZ2_330R [Paramecium bursaria Chlorella virus CZ-2]AGE53173.1 hypothetical protein PBCVFr5L_375R [Paramecium bursaria Chlorella virus Fr5L]AGE59062.1 hypothetical protein PBCVOR070422_329R [Paramecium bursaria Chlorella virus OR0704.2.2]